MGSKHTLVQIVALRNRRLFASELQPHLMRSCLGELIYHSAGFSLVPVYCIIEGEPSYIVEKCVKDSLGAELLKEKDIQYTGASAGGDNDFFDTGKPLRSRRREHVGKA